MMFLYQTTLLTLLGAEVIIPWHFGAAQPISDTASVKQSGLPTGHNLLENSK